MIEKQKGGDFPTFFVHRSCPYFPCHKGSKGENIEEDFHCLFCYCPLYALGEGCGGNYRYLSNGVKDCSLCLLPHQKAGYDHIISHCGQVVALVQQQYEQQRYEREKTVDSQEKSFF